MAYSDYYGAEYKISLTSVIVRRPSSHIIIYSPTHSLTHSLTQIINQSTNQSINQSVSQSVSQSINQSIDGSRDMLRILYFALLYDLRENAQRICVRIIGNTMISY